VTTGAAWTDEHPETAHGRSRPDACSVQWELARASAMGTASVARFWLAWEQPGPWDATPPGNPTSTRHSATS
jgi:hypothetical protein